MPSRPRRTAAEPLAQTSVRFPKPLIRRARIRAATDEISLQQLLVCALECELDRRDKVQERQARRAAGTAGSPR